MRCGRAVEEEEVEEEEEEVVGRGCQTVGVLVVYKGWWLEAMLVFAVALLLAEPALGVEMTRALVEEVGAELKCCVLLIVGALVIWVFAAMLFGVQGDNRPKLPKLEGV